MKLAAAPSSVLSSRPPSSCRNVPAPRSPAPASQIPSSLIVLPVSASIDGSAAAPLPSAWPLSIQKPSTESTSTRPPASQCLPRSTACLSPRITCSSTRCRSTIPALRPSSFMATRSAFQSTAASVVAKVFRDHMMRELDLLHPQYGLAAHKGYATPQHRRALREHGPTPLHRRSFAPVRASDPNVALELTIDSTDLLFDPSDLEPCEESAWA